MKFVIGFLVLVAVGASSAQSIKPKPVYENVSISNVTQIVKTVVPGKKK